MKVRKNMSYIIRDREAGNIIETGFETEELAEDRLSEFEEMDKKEGTYEPNFYEIIKEERTFTTICEELGSILAYFKEESGGCYPISLAEAIILIHRLSEVKKNLEWLESHNKQYTNKQYNMIYETLELLNVPEV
jgi:hypothetical protein